MKKLLLMSALSVATFGTMNAQTAVAKAESSAAYQELPQVKAKAMVSKITNACGLVGDQVGQVNNLYIEYYTKLNQLGADAAKVKALTDDTNAALAKILSPSQLKFWKEASSK